MDQDREQDRYLPSISPEAAVRSRERLYSSIPLDIRLNVPRSLFIDTMEELKDRSAGWRESAGIWAGRVEDSLWQAEVVRFHHHLCDDAGGPLSLELTEMGKYRLYEELAAANLRIVAMIHTHPADWVGLSRVDRQNQICSRLGFWSLVAPSYGEKPWDLGSFGVHVRVSDGWYQLSKAEVDDRVVLAG